MSIDNSNSASHTPSFRRLAFSALVLSAVTGCASIAPQALSNAEISATLQADKQALSKDVEPLNGPLTLDEAIARAIKYNADRRLKMMEEALATGTLEAGNYDMLPKLVASAGYRDRSNDYITRSQDSVTGQQSLANPFISSGRSATTTDLTFSWSLLDFGQSYYAAKQNADRVLVAQERRRKALHILIQDVRTSYWRMVAAQSLKDKVQSAIADAEKALKDAERAENERLRNPLDALRFQRQLLENLRLLEAVEQELSAARIELASLTSLPLGTDYTVSTPAVETAKTWLDLPIAQLEEQALMRNADLRESMYNARIAQQETRRTMLRLFPGLSFNYGYKTSDDSYLINQHWREAGVQVSFNLFNLLAIPSQKRLADAGVSLAEQKRMVTQMAVLTQLHIARLQYANALHQFDRADAIANVENRIADHVTNQTLAEKQTQLDRVSQQTSQILAQLRRYQAMATVQTASSRLQATLGMEPVIADTAGESVQELAAAVHKSLQAWDSGQLPETKN
ncbi:TolC family protein [Herbaspirillum sp. RV1423]|uniref:TolC family protein n=1 Tax=Herbaspirillum sp. RV1423 TaxID=1443993 RepID=UPI0004B85EF3|nr:TolC family protein [Herbaspirillum sp. RV1423]